ncbi:MAG: PQQ-binding-like beta-propeller repeat protein [Planctomycetaceae bacterium]|nr:PQQ-binding-like beta-propeller repeat protein [Planctomycetales bacterium]MCB9923379.1 PQQ-binding-like beta-propeller repeat protein [Planctomycetaceae bacterium]
MRPLCSFLSILCGICCCSLTLADEWPQWRGPERNGVWQETGIVDQFGSEQIAIKWRQAIGAGYSGPTVADGRVYVTDRIVEPEQIERVHCFDWKTGAKVWSHQYPCSYSVGYAAGPRASVTVNEAKAYALGAMGHFNCFDAATGNVLWSHDLNAEYAIEESRRMPIWGIASSPLIYRDLVVVHIGATNDASIVAFDQKTGKERWRSLNDRAQYSAPILVQQAGHEVLVCWTGDGVAALDPASGKVHWRVPFTPRKMPIGIATPVVDGDRLFVTSFYDGSLMLRLGQDKLEVETLWQRAGRDEKNTEALHSIISTPIFDGNYLYGVDSYGELRGLAAATGDRLWEDQTATPRNRWSNIHFVRNADRIWMFNEMGELIIAKLDAVGFHEISRAHLIEPTREQLSGSGRREGVCWAHPAFAYKHVFARNDRELVCASLAADR